MKERITITLDSELIKQIDKRIDGNIIKNRSQQIEILLTNALGTYRPQKAVILVGGKGTRLRPLTYEKPKCLFDVNGKTVTEHLLDLLKKYGVRIRHEAAAAIDGHVTTLEYAADKVAMARDAFARSGLADRITLVHGDAGQWLAQAADASIDLLFLDSDREQYAGWWPQLRRVLRRGGLLVVDNATSHAAQMEPLRALLDADQDFGTSLVPVGNGELLAVRNA